MTAGGIHLRGLMPGQHSSEETSQRWKVDLDAVSDLTKPATETQTFRADGEVFTHNIDRTKNKEFGRVGSKHLI